MQVPCPICNQPSNYDFSSRDLMFNHDKRYDYQHCTNCDFIFQHPLPSLESIAAFYPDNYSVYEEQSRLKSISNSRKSVLKNYYGYAHLSTSIIYDLISPMLKFFNHKFEAEYIQNGKLLDVGCGNGRYLDGMKKLGWQTQGVEFNASAVEVCNLSGLTVHDGDLFSAHFDSNSFDVINVSHVIEHVPNPLAFFTELARVLKPNGSLIIKTPNSQALGRKLFNTNWYANDVPRHLYLFAHKNLVVLASNCGLAIKQFETRSTAKIILNSLDYVTVNTKTPSKRVKWKRILARLYVWLAQYKQQGDEIFVVFTKQ
jgi:2-polyprenyl-3-methyl-5-hydroxy-6-metoxy-1,4-benzoquinol methylase